MTAEAPNDPGGQDPPPATAALVTAPARGGIAVILLTGAQTGGVLSEVFRPRGRPPAVGRLALGWIVRGRRRLDEAVVTLLEGGQAAEINIHGGAHAAREVLALLREHGAEIVPEAGTDPALAGPNRRWGNPAIAREMLEALRSASTPLAASAVTQQWSCGLSALAGSARPAPAALRDAAGALPLMRRLLDPPEVVIAGPPNVGKSALANALAGRKVSIVCDAPGTTRDWVRCLVDADGVPIWLTDTAGLWEPAEGPDTGRDPRAAGLDAEAVRRAWQRIASAALVVRVSVGPPGEYAGLLRRIGNSGSVLDVAGKCDAVAPAAGCGLPVSGLTLEGIEALRTAIRRRLGFAEFDPAAPMAFTDRQRRLLLLAADALERGDRLAAWERLRGLLG